MSMQTTKMPIHFLKPGELYVGDQPALVTTLLGSCVAVTMFNARLRVGAICHGLLPACRNDHVCEGDCADGLKYVECAIRRMLEIYHKRGIVRGEIDVKIFGGSDILIVQEGERKNRTVGRQNLEMALQILEGEGVRIIASDLGGLHGRKILFYSHTGEVLLKRLHRSQALQ